MKTTSLFLAALPTAFAITPAARWGHQAVYVKSQQAMYVIGGEISTSNTQVTNEVLILPLNTSNPTFSLGPNDYLPPHAFASIAINPDSSSLFVVGGMTTSCSTDALAHTLDLANGSWQHSTPNKAVRRRNAGMEWVDNGSNGALMVVGGMADAYVCAASTSAFPAADVLSLPIGAKSLISTRNLPGSLTGSDMAVADFAMTSDANGTMYLIGGQSAEGDLVPLSTIGIWTSRNGWTSQVISGTVPSARVGASLVAHPTLDVLVLHGGSTTDGSTDTPDNLLALLNTTTWSWTSPSQFQPPASSAAAYHTSVMTDQGVMITAFGLGSNGSPRSDVFYFDMRDLTGNAWAWKSSWNSNMLEAYSTTAMTTGTNGVVAANEDSSAPSKKKTTTIVVPAIIGALVLLPLLIWFIRRRVRIAKKRRMARHFSFSSQEDEGDFSNALAQFKGRHTKTHYSFGRDANEKEGTIFSDVAQGLMGAFKRYSGAEKSPRDSWDGVREMSQVRRTSKNRPMKWEEIDFGLGKLDESKVETSSRRSSFSAGAGSPPVPVASTYNYAPDMVGPLIVTINDESPRMGTPRHDGQMPLVPVPAATGLNVAYPTMKPEPAQDGLDWNILAEQLESKPAFRSISPTSTLRSHAHESPIRPQSPQPKPRPLPAPPSLPPLEFQRTSTPTITLINPKTGRRTSDILPSPRAVSSPIAGRQLAGNYPLGRRASGGYAMAAAGIQSESGHRRASNPNLGLNVNLPVIGGRRESKLRVMNATDGDGQEGMGRGEVI